jgi:hypothetical protein
MMGAIHLDHFTKMMLSLPPLPVLSTRALLIRDVFFIQPQPKSFLAYFDRMDFKKLLAGKGGAKIMVRFPKQLQCFLFDLLGNTMTRVLAAGSVADTIVSFRPYSFKHPPKLPAAQTYQLRSPRLRDPLIQCLVDNMQPFRFSPAHGDHVHFRHNILQLRQGIVT